MKPRAPAPAELTPDGRLAVGSAGELLGYRLAQASVTTDQVFDAVMRDGPALRKVEFTVLALVQANPGLTASALAQALALTPPNITMWLDRLEGRGLIERERSATDRRAQHLRVTREGAAAVDLAARALQQAEAEALAALSAAELAMLVELLQKVARGRRKRAASHAAAKVRSPTAAEQPGP